MRHRTRPFQPIPHELRPLSEARAAELAGITLAHFRHLTDPSDQWQGRGIFTPMPTPSGPVFDPMEVEAFAEHTMPDVEGDEWKWGVA